MIFSQKGALSPKRLSRLFKINRNKDIYRYLPAQTNRNYPFTVKKEKIYIFHNPSSNRGVGKADYQPQKAIILYQMGQQKQFFYKIKYCLSPKRDMVFWKKEIQNGFLQTASLLAQTITLKNHSTEPHFCFIG